MIPSISSIRDRISHLLASSLLFYSETVSFDLCWNISTFSHCIYDVFLSKNSTVKNKIKISYETENWTGVKRRRLLSTSLTQDDTFSRCTRPSRAQTAVLYISPGFPRNTSRAETETRRRDDSFTQPCHDMSACITQAYMGKQDM